MRLHTLATSMILGLLLAAASHGADLELGGRFQAEYNDNVFSQIEDKADDAIFTVEPYGRIIERNGSVLWNATYRPSFVGYLDTDNIDGWQHEFEGTARWQATERTSLIVSERFARLLSRSRFNQSETLETGEVVTEAEFGLNDYQRNLFSVTLAHQLNLGHSLVGQVSHSLSDFDTGRDTTNVSMNASYRYQLSPRTQLSLGPRYSRQNVDGTEALDESITEFYGISGSWEHLLGRGLTLTMAAGPTWIDTNSSNQRATTTASVIHPLRPVSGFEFFTDAATCPSLPDGALVFATGCQILPAIALIDPADNIDPMLPIEPGAPAVEDTRLTFFANASIEKLWQQWTAALSYRRQESPSSGVGAAAITDSLMGQLSYRPSPRWTLRWTGTFTRRSQATEGLAPVLIVEPCGGGGPACELGAPAGSARSVGLRLVTVDTDDRLDQLIGRFHVSYRLRERITLDASLFYLDQTESGDRFVTDRNLSRFSTWVGIRWDLDPIPLPF